MPLKPRTTLKSYFEANDRPTASQYIDLIDSIPNFVDDNPTYGFNWREDWDNSVRYVKYDSVYYATTGASYVCIVAHDAFFVPTNTTYWSKISEKGADAKVMTSIAFVGDDLVFTYDDASTDTIVGAKTDLTGPAGADGVVQTVAAGTGISVDSTDPANPVVSSTITEATRASLGLDTDDTVTFANLSGTNTGDDPGLENLVEDTSPQLGGDLDVNGHDIQLGETSIKLDATLSADEKWSGITTAGTLGATIASGDLCYLNNDDSRWELVDANLSDGYNKQLGICLAGGNDGDTSEFLVFGKVRSAAFPAFTVGSPLYISETAGDITHTQPTTADVAIRLVGFALTAEDLMFNPSNDYIVHA